MSTYYNFFKETTVNGVKERDLIWTNISRFEFNLRYSFYLIQQVDLYSPDEIAKQVLGSEYYWEFLLAINGIENPFTDLEPGTYIKIPNMMDVYAFYDKFIYRSTT